jgi:uncharacterized membrane protein YccC
LKEAGIPPDAIGPYNFFAPDFSPLVAKLRSAGPPLMFGLRLWASVSLALYVAFWLELDNPFWAGTSAAIVCQPQLGASLRKGWFRMIGTSLGAVMSIVLVACFANDRVLFLGGLALWGAVCAFVATILRNFASYAAALAGYTAAIVAGDLLGQTGGVDANAAFLLAVARASEIIIGIACAGIVVAGTDLGGARRRLATLFADLAAEITAGFTDTLVRTGPELPATRPIRHEFIRRVVALDPVIDLTLGESSQIRYHSPVLQSAVDGLFAALCGWRAMAIHLVTLRAAKRLQETAAILETVPQELRSAGSTNAAARWVGDPAALHRLCEATVRRLIALPAGTPSARLLADKAAEAFAGIAQALNGLALLVADPARPIPRRGNKRLRVPDWLPALVNAGRALVVIGAVSLYWIVSAWPGGSQAITFAVIVVLLLGPRADEAYGAALLFTVGAVLSLVLAAIVEFAVLPGLGTETFAAFCLVIGACLVPIGALLAQARQPWQLGLFTGMTIQFMPLLAPTNPMNYDPLAYYNTGLAIITGCAVGALSFLLIPPLSPVFRTRRLLTLTLRDLRRVALGRIPDGWESHIHGRLSAMPEEATPLQRAQLLAALSAGSEIIRLRDGARRIGKKLFGVKLDSALKAVGRGNSELAAAHLAGLDEMLAISAAETQPALRMRASILVLSEALADHATYFDGAAG